MSRSPFGQMPWVQNPMVESPTPPIQLGGVRGAQVGVNTGSAPSPSRPAPSTANNEAVMQGLAMGQRRSEQRRDQKFQAEENEKERTARQENYTQMQEHATNERVASEGFEWNKMLEQQDMAERNAVKANTLQKDVDSHREMLKRDTDREQELRTLADQKARDTQVEIAKNIAQLKTAGGGIVSPALVDTMQRVGTEIEAMGLEQKGNHMMRQRLSSLLTNQGAAPPDSTLDGVTKGQAQVLQSLLQTNMMTRGDRAHVSGVDWSQLPNYMQAAKGQGKDPYSVDGFKEVVSEMVRANPNLRPEVVGKELTGFLSDNMQDPVAGATNALGTNLQAMQTGDTQPMSTAPVSQQPPKMGTSIGTARSQAVAAALSSPAFKRAFDTMKERINGTPTAADDFTKLANLESTLSAALSSHNKGSGMANAAYELSLDRLQRGRLQAYGDYLARGDVEGLISWHEEEARLLDQGIADRQKFMSSLNATRIQQMPEQYQREVANILQEASYANAERRFEDAHKYRAQAQAILDRYTTEAQGFTPAGEAPGAYQSATGSSAPQQPAPGPSSRPSASASWRSRREVEPWALRGRMNTEAGTRGGYGITGEWDPNMPPYAIS